MNFIVGEETKGLLSAPQPWTSAKSGRWVYSRAHIIGLHAMNITLLVAVFLLTMRLSSQPSLDPSLGVYCKLKVPLHQDGERCSYIVLAPANEAVEWIKEYKFTPALFSKTPYMGFPTNETDQLWLDLYDCK